MGTTLTLAYSLGSELYLGHVGDSRAYLLRGGQMHQLTRDHTRAQELVDRLNAAGIEGEDAARVAVTALSEAADSAEVRSWWDHLSKRDQEREKARTNESLQAADKGPFQRVVKVYANLVNTSNA